LTQPPPSPPPGAPPGASELLTPRLRLRPWREQDAEPMAAINRDPEVTRYLNRATDEAAVAGFIEATVAHWAKHGFGHFAVTSREPATAGRLLGFVGVAYPGFLPAVADRPELGWRLAHSAWGRGLATEGALAARDDAFSRLGLGELIAIVHPDNQASRRVAEKVGMRIERMLANPLLGIEVELWQIDAPASA
jgi:RimJ/RimL family protein N-acetyltransferase